MLQFGALGCARPEDLAAVAGLPVHEANMSGFGGLPSTRVFVHPPAQDRLISKGLLEGGRWAHRHNDETRQAIVSRMARALSRAVPGARFADVGANLGTFSLPLLAAGRHRRVTHASGGCRGHAHVRRAKRGA